MRSLIRAVTVLAALVFAVTIDGPAHADDAVVKEVQAVISAQIDAFKHDDGAKAYSFASRDVQMMFPSIEMFMSMVKTGYAPVYHPQQFQFGPFQASGDILKQTVELTAADGTAWTAEYSLSKQVDGTLKISGCRLAKKPGIGA